MIRTLANLAIAQRGVAVSPFSVKLFLPDLENIDE